MRLLSLGFAWMCYACPLIVGLPIAEDSRLTSTALCLHYEMTGPVILRLGLPHGLQGTQRNTFECALSQAGDESQGNEFDLQYNGLE